MNPEGFELLVASLAEGSSPTRVEAFLRLRMEHLRRRSERGEPDFPLPALDLTPENRQSAEVRARRELDQARTQGAELLTPWDEDYPRRLRTIAGPPPVLYRRGAGHSLDRSVAVVGSLTPSRWGTDSAEAIAGFLAGRGWTVVSGLAIGIDRRAHEAVIRAGGTTVAVLGGGLDRITPLSHLGLAERILEGGGCLFSELPFGTPATAASRIRRDRLQSGMTLATVMVESELEGGAMHTARYALEQGRRLLVPVPRDGSAFQSGGALKLLYRDGSARPLELPGGLQEMGDGLERLLDREISSSRSP